MLVVIAELFTTIKLLTTLVISSAVYNKTIAVNMNQMRIAFVDISTLTRKQ